jgi:threonyl-tRNA synthetase
MENQTVAVRTRSGEDLGAMTLDQFSERLRTDIANRSRAH